MNAHFIRTIFRENAHPRINKNPHDLEDFYDFKENILVAAGWRPGFSTDFDAVILAKYLGIKKSSTCPTLTMFIVRTRENFRMLRKLKRFLGLISAKWWGILGILG